MGMSLFVTLEPCTRRGVEKVPCAVRVAESRVGAVYIGTLDPNPQITGRGELFLSSHTTVDRFPAELKRELTSLNDDFFGLHIHGHVPSVSPYAGGRGGTFRPVLASQREGLLQQSLDLMTGSEGDLFVFAGGLSWLREMQVGLLSAALAGRRILILCAADATTDNAFVESRHAAQSLGAAVGVADIPFSARGTIASPYTDDAAMICIERSPALHGHLFQKPHDSGLLDALTHLFSTLWTAATPVAATPPQIASLDQATLRTILQTGVPAYQRATIELTKQRVTDLTLLPKSLERFKLFRLSQLQSLRERYSLPAAARIVGSPWAIVPPIVERRPDGTLVVIDGAHRVHTARSLSEPEIAVLLVSEVTQPLPARPQTDPDRIAIGFERMSRSERYDDLRPEFLRPIRSAFRDAFRRM